MTPQQPHTDAYLDDHDTDRLGAAWHTLAELAPQLDELVAGDVIGKPTALGIRIARAPASRPPINVAAIDHLDIIAACATGWTDCLNQDAGVPIPADVRTATLCRHLHVHADRIATQPWARDCFEEVKDLVTKAWRIANPDDDGSITDRRHLADADVHHRAHQARGDAADMAAVHHAVTGEHLPESTIRSWVRRGKMTEHIADDGSPEYAYIEVAQLARMRRARRPRRADA